MGRANKSPPPHVVTLMLQEIDKKQITKQNIGQMEVSALENSIGKEAGQAEELQSAMGRLEKGGLNGKNIKEVRGKSHIDIWGRALCGRRSRNVLGAFEEVQGSQCSWSYGRLGRLQGPD